jgi:Pyruvate/2-oxoacid:ferredoxin oxidoreductase delta subunit
MLPIQIQTPSQNGVHHHKSFTIIKRIGLGLFFAGMLVFIASLGLSDYRITTEGLHAIENRISPERLQLLQPLVGQTYASKFALLDAIEKQLSEDKSIKDYDLGVAKLWVSKTSATGLLREKTMAVFLLSIVLATVGGLVYILPQARESLPGVKNNRIWFSSTMARGIIGIAFGVLLITFYVLLYWYPHYIANMIILTDPVSRLIRNQPADQWFFYGFLYTLTIIVMGIRMFIKYRHSRYHLVRTASIIFFQFGFAFMIPSLLERMNRPSMDFKNAWPLNYTFFMDWNLNSLLNSGNLGVFMLVWGVILAIVVVPVMTYFFGKRWYCSWVCGCGGMAETLGDPFRHLSDKSLKAWRSERIIIHSVLVFAVVMTAMQIANFVSNGSLFSNYTWRVNQWYSFFIGAAFAGVAGMGFYPLLGNRVWCRFGCPLAAIFGIVQKFKSRFRITTNGGQCISCGNCSTYCEMGIDVRWYAQRGQNIIRASCVGCGVCAAVCPRGVLSLEI